MVEKIKVKKDGKYIRKIKSLSESSKVYTAEYYNGENLNVYNEIEFINCKGKLNGNQVEIEGIAPYASIGFVVR